MAAAVGDEGAIGRPLPPLLCLEASELSLRATDRAYHDIRRLANILSRVNLDSRREDLLDYIRLNRARFIKAYATISWLSGSQGEVVVNTGNALFDVRSQREKIDTDQFFFMHGGLFGARQRVYDVPVAVDVIVGGQYTRLPKGIEFCGGDIDPHPIFQVPADRGEVVQRVDRAMRLALLRKGGVPPQFSSHTVRDGILILAVAGEFELAVTLQSEGEDARWTLLEAKVDVKAREGESITAPATNFRQQRYLHQVVQKAMDVHGGADEKFAPNPLLAAYQVCHDLCCSVMLEILHAQAQKLAARIGGLWAAHLVVAFHKDLQVLDLCLWQTEFSTGVAGSGQNVGLGGMRSHDPSSRRGPLTSSMSEMAGTNNLPAPPEGCRYVRVHRPVDGDGKIVASLGPVTKLPRSDDSVTPESGPESDTKAGDSGGAADEVSSGIVQLRPDNLSCAHLMLTTARIFASQKIKALVADVDDAARQLRTCFPQVALFGSVSAHICPWGGGAVEVSVDVKTGRYVVKDTLRHSSKAMAGCNSRLQEALNIMPSTDTQSLRESIVATLGGGRSALVGRSPVVRDSTDSEPHDLRQQHVRRCLTEAFRFLRRSEMEHMLQSAFGMVPHRRWQALLGRHTSAVDAGVDSWRADSSGTLRTFVRLCQFREDGVRLTDEWRCRSRSYRLKRRGASVIELTKAERAATVGQISATAPTGVGLGIHSSPPLLPGQGVTDGWHLVGGTLPALVASLAEGSEGGDDSIRPVDTTRANGMNIWPAGDVLDETSEVLSFFLEVGVNESLDVEHTFVAAAMSSGRRARSHIRPVVGETYQISPSHRQEAPPHDSLEAALLPSEPSQFVGAKRLSSSIVPGGAEISNGMGRDVRAKIVPNGTTNARRALHASAAGSTSNSIALAMEAPLERSAATAESSVEAAEAQLHTNVQIYYRLIPFARLQHALLRVGTGLSLDFRDLTRFPIPSAHVPTCVVLLAGEEGWSNPELAAASASVRFFAAHTQVDSWEWEVGLESGTLLMEYAGGSVAAREGMAETMRCVYQELPLVQHIDISGVSINGGGVPSRACEESAATNGLDAHDGTLPGALHGEGTIRFRYPSLFSVHSMCRSFALAGEGLAAMHTLAAQAVTLQQRAPRDAGYAVESCSPLHVAMRDRSSNHVVLLTHSAFSARHIASAERPRLLLISTPGVFTLPSAMRELEESVKKHRDLSALLHGLSRVVPVLAVVSRTLTDVSGQASAEDDIRTTTHRGFALEAVSPACFVLTAHSTSITPDERLQSGSSVCLVIEAIDQVRLSRTGQIDLVVDTPALQNFLLEWIASNST